MLDPTILVVSTDFDTCCLDTSIKFGNCGRAWTDESCASYRIAVTDRLELKIQHRARWFLEKNPGLNNRVEELPVVDAEQSRTGSYLGDFRVTRKWSGTNRMANCSWDEGKFDESSNHNARSCDGLPLGQSTLSWYVSLAYRLDSKMVCDSPMNGAIVPWSDPHNRSAYWNSWDDNDHDRRAGEEWACWSITRVAACWEMFHFNMDLGRDFYTQMWMCVMDRAVAWDKTN